MSPLLSKVKSVLLASLAVSTVVSFSEVASAQDSGAFYLDRAQLSGAPDDPFMTWRPLMSETARFYLSGTVGYSLNPLRLSNLVDEPNGVDGQPFEHQVITYLGAGVQINKRVGFEIMQPIALVNVGGQDPSEGNPGITRGLSKGAGIMDTRLSLRFMAIESDDRTFRWGGGGAIFLPTGNEVRFTSDGETTTFIYTNFEYHIDELMLAWMIGPHFRPNQGPDPSSLQVGNELRWTFGAFLPMFDDRTRIGAEVWGQFGFHDVSDTQTGNTTLTTTESAFFRGNNTQVEWLAQIRRDMNKEKSWYLQGGLGTRLSPGYGGDDFRLLMQIGTHAYLSDLGPDDKAERWKAVDRVALSADKDTDGDGFPDDIDQCVTIKEDGKPPFPDDGCPDLDRDDDGIPDARDKCPDVPEDKDGIEDEDGCPEDDADKDGIIDAEDACPLEKGVANDDPEKNGCPAAKKKKIVVSETEVKLLEPIQFEYNKANILPVSFEILDEVVDLLKERPAIRIGVYGHTDNRGAAAYNKALSGRRAASVVRYLTTKGIAKDRLESEGFGMEQPRVSNDTDEGRAQNRRVEFKILSQ